jgi:hypothetical protein
MLIKDEPTVTVAPFKHNGAPDFSRGTERTPFIDEKQGPNDNRFSLLDTYDKSTYLSKVKRTKMNMSFAGQPKRDTDLIRKAGVHNHDLGGKSILFYNSGQKDGIMPRVDKGVREFKT